MQKFPRILTEFAKVYVPKNIARNVRKKTKTLNTRSFKRTICDSKLGNKLLTFGPTSADKYVAQHVARFALDTNMLRKKIVKKIWPTFITFLELVLYQSHSDNGHANSQFVTLLNLTSRLCPSTIYLFLLDPCSFNALLLTASYS